MGVLILEKENILGERLRKLREKANLSQKLAATKFGLTNHQLSRYETGKANPDPDLIAKFADFYEVTADYLLGRTTNSKLTERDEKDISEYMERLKDNLRDGKDNEKLSFYGEPLSSEAMDSLLDSLEYIERQTKVLNKKYIPKKYRNKD